MGEITITPQALQTSAQTFRKELLLLPVIGLAGTKEHMTVRTGIRYAETVGQMDGNVEIGPYDPKRTDDTGVNIDGRTLNTYLGSVIKQFDPNSVYKSIYGSSIVSGKELTSADINKYILAFMMNKIAEGLNMNVWNAVRKDNGTLTKDLFNGFDTITQTEITGGKISTSEKNLFEFSEEITSINALELLKQYYRKADDNLKGKKTKLFVPITVYDAYCDDFKATTGAIAYNTQFERTFLEGSNNNCEIVALSNKSESQFLHLTTKDNMLIGVNQEGEEEKINIDRFSPFLLDFSAAMFFGTQLESINAKRLFVGKLKTA